jgi:hypothetical protein
MNSALEALNIMNDEHNELIDHYNLTGGFGNNYLVVKEALKALEHFKSLDFPRKPSDVFKDELTGLTIGRCGYCSNLVSKRMKYCPICGQHLDWR